MTKEELAATLDGREYLEEAVKEEVTFESLIGEHVLEGVDMFDTQVESWEGGPMEDPEDGYRSCMKSLTVDTEPIKNSFAGVRVLVRQAPSQEFSNDGSGSISILDRVGSWIAVAGCIVLAIVVVVSVGDAANEYGKVQEACVPCSIVHIAIFHDSPHSYPISRFGKFYRDLQRIAWSNQSVGNSNVRVNGLSASAHILNRPYDPAFHSKLSDFCRGLSNVSDYNIGSSSEALRRVIAATNTNRYPSPFRVHEGPGVLAGGISSYFSYLSLSADSQQCEERNENVSRSEDAHYPFAVTHKWMNFLLGFVLIGISIWCLWSGCFLCDGGRRWYLYLPLLVIGLILWFLGYGVIIRT